MKYRMTLVAGFVAAFVSCALVPAQAESSRILFKSDGVTSGLGTSSAKSEKDWAAVLSYSFDAETPSSGGAVAGVPAIGNFLLRKNSDSASAALLEKWMTNAVLPVVEIEYRRTIGTSEVVALRIKLTNAIVLASRFVGESGSDHPAVDEVELGFGKLEMTAYRYDSAGSLAGSTVVVIE